MKSMANMHIEKVEKKGKRTVRDRSDEPWFSFF